MAYSHPNLVLVGPGGNSAGPRLYSYTTVDTQADVNSSGYFNDAAGDLNVGDRIMANVDTDGTPAWVDFLVLSNTGTVVDVNNGTVISVTDSD